jgi:2Fe-2S ferredoxin
MVNLIIEDWDGKRKTVELTHNSGPNLMEIIKEAGFNIMATCGGMGLCATCHVLVLEGHNDLPPAIGEELSTLDTLPDAEWNSRLSCQLKTDTIKSPLTLKIKESNY